MTEHLSEEHVGKGKAEYECLWKGCVQCECPAEVDCDHTVGVEETPVDENKETRGRKFGSRQKIMRHLQVSAQRGDRVTGFGVMLKY